MHAIVQPTHSAQQHLQQEAHWRFGMDWNIRYNRIYQALQQSAGSDVCSFYSQINDWTEDLIVITVILLSSEALLSNTHSQNTQAYEFLDFCEGERGNQQSTIFKCLHSLLLALPQNANPSIKSKALNEINESVSRYKVFSDFELQALLFIIQSQLGDSSSSKPKADQFVAKLHVKIEDYLKTDDSLTPYTSFLQDLKYMILTIQLARFRSTDKWSAYLTASYQLINEGLLDSSPANAPLLLWYNSKSDILSLIPLFTKSLLLEPYGYFKNSILQKLRLYFVNQNKFEAMGKQLDPNCPITKILRYLAFDKFFTLSPSSGAGLLLLSIQSELAIDDSLYQRIFNNLIDLNIIFASRKFSSIRISTLLTLFQLHETEYTLSQLIDAVSNLSRDMKVVVRIDQCDEILSFPLLQKRESKTLDSLFAHILPQALERDWDKLMAGE